MRRLRNNRRRLSWIAIIAVLGNVLAGALGHAPAQAADAIDDIFPAHLICTGSGSHLEVPGDGQDTDGGTPTHCAVCGLLLSAGVSPIATPASVAVAFPPTFVLHPPRFGLRTLADHLRLGGIRSRAPPLAA